MRKLFLIFFFLVAVVAHGEPVAFVDVNVVPMDRERALTGQTVIVNNGRIVRMGNSASVKIPEGALRVAASGHYLIPGLAEMHAHVPTDDDSIDRVLALFLVNGVTTIRGMLGHPSHLGLREALAAGERLGPRLVTSGPSMNGQSVTGPIQARQMVREQHDAGYDFLKLHPGLLRLEFDAIVEVANSLGMPFAGHVSADVGLNRALDARQDSIDHLDGYMQQLLHDDVSLDELDQGFFGLLLAGLVDEDKIDAVAKRTADAGTWNVPTQILIEHYASPESPDVLAARDEMRYMPRSTVESWRNAKRNLLSDDDYDADIALRAIEIRRQLVKALHENGAGLALGSDAPQVFNVPGFATREELEVLVAAGLTPFEALQVGTVNPARYFGTADTRGQVQEGFDADLVLLEGNPLENITNTRSIAGVMIGGKWLDRDALDALLAKFDERQ